jgi:hypothetical protein
MPSWHGAFKHRTKLPFCHVLSLYFNTFIGYN